MSPAVKEDRVDVTPLREAFLASGMTKGDVCRRLGWTKARAGHGPADTSRLGRALGMQLLAPGRARPGRARYMNRTISYELAARIAEAIGVDPVDVGL